jgi:hypothetical protein
MLKCLQKNNILFNFNKIHGITLLSKIVQRSDKKNTCVNGAHQGLEVGVMSNALGTYIVFIEGMLV